MILLTVDSVSHPLLQALVWTLLHSLWEGLLIAILVSMGCLAGRNRSANFRYNLLTTGMILFLVASGGTFAYLLASASAGAGTNLAGAEGAFNHSVINSGDWLPLSTYSTAGLYFQKFTQAISRLSPYITLAWIMLVFAQLLRMSRSMAYIHRIRHQHTHPVESRWTGLFHTLLRRTEIKRKVQLLESETVKVPLAIGHFKPLVLVPLGMLTQLPEDEVEAILLHELAHIRRHDYLVNLVQGLAEAAFFFNPALMWMSARLREEREHCCDDLAISHLHNREKFVRALLSFQAFCLQRWPSEGLAMGLTGSRHQLLNRVKRILQKENKKIYAMEKSLFTLGIGALCLAGAISFTSFQDKPQPSPAGPVRLSEKPVADTVPSSSGTDSVRIDLNYYSVNNKSSNGKLTRSISGKIADGSTIKMVAEDGRLTQVFRNGTAVPEKDWAPYQELLNRLGYKIAGEEQKAKRDREMAIAQEHQARLQRMEMEKEQQLTQLKLQAMELDAMKRQNEQEELYKKSQAYNYQQRERLLEQQKKMLKLQDAYKEMDQLKTPTEEQYMERKNLQEKMLDLQEHMQMENEMLNTRREDFERELKMQKEQMLMLKEKQEQLLLAENLRHITENNPEQPGLKRKARQDAYIQSQIMPIVEDLVANHIIDSPEDLTFELTQKRFQVNGKNQPYEILKKFVDRYLNDPRDSIRFSNRNNSRSFSINLH